VPIELVEDQCERFLSALGDAEMASHVTDYSYRFTNSAHGENGLTHDGLELEWDEPLSTPFSLELTVPARRCSYCVALPTLTPFIS
jgi:hypothetical protein